eukprot:gene4593-7975_t
MSTLFHFLAALNFVGQQIFVRSVLPSNNLFRVNPLGSVFLTNQANQLLTLYFCLNFFSSITQNEKLKTKLNNYSGILFTLGTFVCFAYYGLVHHAKEVQSKIATIPYFGLVMLWTHGISFVFVLIDLIIKSKNGEKLNMKRDAKYSLIYFIFYITYSLILFNFNRVWPYPFQNELTVFQTIVFDVIVLISIVVVSLLSNLFNRILIKMLHSEEKLE